MAELVRLDLTPHPTSAAVARRAALHACRDLTSDIDSLVLCTSELVTNAIVHGLPPITLEIALAGGAIRVTVRDGGGAAVNGIAAGRGLGIVRALARGWGSEREADGNRTWFEVPRLALNLRQ